MFSLFLLKHNDAPSQFELKEIIIPILESIIKSESKAHVFTLIHRVKKQQTKNILL